MIDKKNIAVPVSLFIGITAYALPDASDSKPNILIILADDCSRHDIGCYGSLNKVTPNIDTLAKTGMMFSNASCSSSMSTPARHSLYTGLYPYRHGGYANHSNTSQGIKSLPHYLKECGYRVGISGKTDVRPEENFPFENIPGFPVSCVSKNTTYSLDGISRFISDEGNAPFCLVVASTNPHVPYTAGLWTDPKNICLPPHIADTEASRRKYSLYLAEIAALDRQVGEVLGVLEKSGKRKNTIVIFLSEQGAQMPGSKWTLWQPGVMAAIIVSWPGIIKPGTTSDILVQYEDIVPTLLDIAEYNTSGKLDGVSFLDVLECRSVSGKRKYSYYFHDNSTEGGSYQIRAVSDGKYKLIWNLSFKSKFYTNFINEWERDWETAATGESIRLLSRFQFRPEFELYDIEKDPFEMRNIYNMRKHASTASRLEKALLEWMSSQNDPGIPAARHGPGLEIGLSYKIGPYRLFLFRFRDISRSPVFQHPGHVPAESPHGLQAFGVLRGLPGKPSVHTVPVLGRDYRHIRYGKILVQPVKGRARPSPAAYGDSGRRLVSQVRRRRIEKPVEKGAQGSVRSGIVHRGPDHEPVSRLYLLPDFIIEAVVEDTPSRAAAFPAGDAALYGLCPDGDNLCLYTVNLQGLRHFRQGDGRIAVLPGTPVQ